MNPWQQSMERNALAMFPAQPAEFRQTWDTATAWWIRDTVAALSDDRLTVLAEAMRGILLTGRGDLMDVWRATATEAGVL